MSLLDNVNNVLRETGFPDVLTVVGNGNQSVRAILAQAQREGKQMAKKRWSILTKRQTFTTVSSAESYSLPNDFYAFVGDTQWNTTTKRPQTGPVSEEHWQANKSGLVSITINDRFQIRADGNSNRFFIDPIPTASQDISFFYITNSWCRASGGQRQNEIKADDDVVLLDNEVFELGMKWRFLRAQNRSFQDERTEYFIELNKAFAEDGGAPTLRIRGVGEGVNRFIANIPDTGFGP